MAKAAGQREASKTLKQRFKRQATSLIEKGRAKDGKSLSTKEIGRRAMARATRAHDKAATARQLTSKNAKVRAFASFAPTRTATTSKSKRQVIGKTVRRARTTSDQNPNTGAQQTALRAGRRAVKASVRSGATSRRSGAKSLAQLAAMDPTTRRTLVNRGNQVASGSNSRPMSAKGMTIDRNLTAIRRAAKAAGGKKTTKSKKTTQRAPSRTTRPM